MANVDIISKKEYDHLVDMLSRIERAGTLKEWTEDVGELSDDDKWHTTTRPFISPDTGFWEIHSRVLTIILQHIASIEKDLQYIKYYSEYCENMYNGYKPREKSITNPDILKYIKDYEKYKEEKNNGV